MQLQIIVRSHQLLERDVVVLVPVLHQRPALEQVDAGFFSRSVDQPMSNRLMKGVVGTAIAIVSNLFFASRPDLTSSKTPYAPVFIEQSPSSPMGSRAVLSRPGRMTGMATAVYASVPRAAPRQLLGGAKPNT